MRNARTAKTRTKLAVLAPPAEIIERRIFFIRGEKVMLDADLAALYQVATKDLNKAVKRNPERFPKDFMFQLTAAEYAALRFQTGTSNRGGRRYLPYAFTEQGVAMLSSVLSGKRAAHVNILIMRTFVKMREAMATHKDLAAKVEALERKYEKHGEELQLVFKAIRQLIEPRPLRPKGRYGFGKS
jgi:hypothetical protein